MSKHRDPDYPDYYEPRTSVFDRVLDGLLDRLGPRATGLLGILLGLPVLIGSGYVGVWLFNLWAGANTDPACALTVAPPDADCSSALFGWVVWPLLFAAVGAAFIAGVVIWAGWRFLTEGDPRDRTP